MTKQLFKPNVEEDLNRLHNVSLTEGQISTILYILEGYNPLDANGYDPEFREDIDNIFEQIADLSDTSRADDFYKQSHSNRNGKDLDSL